MKYNNKSYLTDYFNTNYTISIIFIVLFFLIQAWSATVFSQIKIYERGKNDPFNDETIFQSDKRIKINLNGEWNLSLNNNTFYKINVPFATDDKSSLFLSRYFTIDDSLLQKYNFIFYSEGINYESEVKINDVIISRNSGGCKFIFSEIQENILKINNVISVKINSDLNNTSTFPLSSQINYGRNYSGILCNTYILAVPKIYISESLIKYEFPSENSILFSNFININSLNIDSLLSISSNFFIKTEIIRKSDTASIYESPLSKLEAKSYQNFKITNTIPIKTIELWSPENPVLYKIKTSIIFNDNVVDNIIYETGFKKTRIEGPDLYINNTKIKLKGMNYFEDLPNYTGALEYASVEKDLRNIKDLGFNCIRVPGKSSHPFVVKIAQRLGLFLLQEFPINEVPSEVLSSEKYLKNAYEYIENIIKRDLYSPAILFWGIGNDFDVTNNHSEYFASKIIEFINSIDTRPIYYTSKNFENDIVNKIIPIKGYNISNINYTEAKQKLEKIDNSKFNFISGIGVSSDNDNRNGFGDVRSAEYQAKYLTEAINFSVPLSGFLLNSYADYNTDSPLLLHFDKNNPYLRTDGLFDFNRNPKYSVNILKRLLNNQGYQKIPEGNVIFNYSVSSNYFVIFGLTIFIFFLMTISKIRNFKDNLWKSILKPKNFLNLIKEQNSIPLFHNLILLIFVSSIISLLFSSILYSLRLSPDFYLLFSKLVESNSLKLFLIWILDKPLFLILFLMIAIIMLFVITYLLMLLMIKIIKKNAKFRSSFSVFIWSFTLFLIFLPFGIIFSKTFNMDNFSLLNVIIYLYFAVLLYALFKLINGAKYVFDLSLIKSYIYGLLLIFTIFFINYYYFISYKSIDIFFNLIKSYR